MVEGGASVGDGRIGKQVYLPILQGGMSENITVGERAMEGRGYREELIHIVLHEKERERVEEEKSTDKGK
jgi:hypothetical protein